MGHTQSARPRDDSRFSSTKQGTSAPPSVQVTPAGCSQSVDFAGITQLVHEKIPDAPRERLLWVARRPVEGCRAPASSYYSWAAILPGSDPCVGESTAQDAPLVVCARHKAIAAQAELDALDGNEVAALEKLDSFRDSCLAAGHQCDEVSLAYDSLRRRLESSAQTKRVALQVEVVAADAALEAALAAILAIIQVGACEARLSLNRKGSFSSLAPTNAPCPIGRLPARRRCACRCAASPPDSRGHSARSCR